MKYDLTFTNAAGQRGNADRSRAALRRFKQIKELVADLLELAQDSRCEDPCWKDPARRYCELRNEAVRLGLREGTLIEMDEDGKK